MKPAPSPDHDAEYRARMNADADRVGVVDLAKMSIEELYALADGLRTASEVISGLRSQPRFLDEGETENKAGSALENINDLINGARTALTLEAETRVPGLDEINHLFSILATGACDGFCTPAEALQEVSRIASSVARRKPTRASQH